MTAGIQPSDVAILDLLRKQNSMTVSQLAKAMQVTATAVRQRLVRLLAFQFIERHSTAAGRGRPSHYYSLTDKGRRQTGENFADLAVALWEEIRCVADSEVRKGLLQRIAHRLAENYSEQIEGESVEERMDSLAKIFSQRSVPFSVEHRGESENEEDSALDLPVLTALACPYPSIAEQDRTICAMERMMFSEALGEKVRLTGCRLDGGNCCTFEVSEATKSEPSPASSPSPLVH